MWWSCRPSVAITNNLVGPNLSRFGVKYDVRRDVPYSGSIPERSSMSSIGVGEVGSVGDCFDRYQCA